MARQTVMSGVSQTDNSVTTNKLELTQNFLGVDFALAYRPQRWRWWAIKGHMEYSVGTSAKIAVLEGPPIDDSDIELPQFLVFGLSTSRTIKVSRRVRFEPAVKLGLAATANPPILIAEILGTIRLW